eukprot:c18925_g1_i1 orf=357-1235(-)
MKAVCATYPKLGGHIEVYGRMKAPKVSIKRELRVREISKLDILERIALNSASSLLFWEGFTMSTESVKVLNTWLSMFGMRVLLALKEKGVEYEYVEQDLVNKSQLLLELNPIYKKVPVLIHKGKPICESLIIVQYIDETWPSLEGHTILPKDPYQRSVARFWADYVDKKVYDSGMRIIRSPEGEQRERAKEDLKESMATLDGALCKVSGGGPYFGGQYIGFVDIALAPFLCWFEAWETLGEFKILDEAEYPHLSKWATVVVEHPTVKDTISIAPPHKIVDFAHWLRKVALGA